MNQLKFVIYTFLSLLTLTTISSCNKDDVNVKNLKSDSSIELRTNSLGSYSVENGRIKFPTIEDYQQTVTYLQSATDAQLVSFRNTNSIETAAKAYTSFVDLVDDENLTSTQIETIEQQYSSKVKISINGEGDKEVNIKYAINPEITNLNGEYQVGQTVIKQAGTKLISITNPTLVDPSTVNETTSTNGAIGVYVTETVLAISPPCCPTSDSKTLEYNDGKRKRVRASYVVANTTQVFNNPADGRWKLVFPQLTVDAVGEHHRRKCFVFCWWSGSKTSMQHDWNINISHSLAGVANPIIIDRTQSNGNTSEIRFTNQFNGNPISILTSFPINYGINVCVNSVYQRVIANNRTVTITCN
ncbi:MAG: hypothetical protein LC127_18025 [Chitinophagales bacterium]|nr:MAG: hypothetical protein UZ08_BCD001000053 [Candidatus Parvibacillus calidus]MCZ2340044.1 hypothetical protein [Chitinophagales bacterium]WKZ64121.1 MAG: hypothetical protein QY315_04835 [Saprospiraceae bacterium]